MDNILDFIFLWLKEVIRKYKFINLHDVVMNGHIYSCYL